MERKLLVFLAVLLLEAITFHAIANPIEDKQALLDFINNIPHSRVLNWNKDSSVCDSWTGVYCNSDKSRVVSLRLPGVGFHGLIPPNTLSRLSALQILSLRLNSITGPFPSDFYKLENLTALFLQSNNFSGSLPLDWSAWKSLTILNLSNNDFYGSIPSSMSNSSSLASLNLANNSLSSEIPDLQLPNLLQLDLSNNHLTGHVPPSLQRFPRSAFAGNNISYDNAPPPAIPARPPSPEPEKKSNKLSEPAILGIILGGCVAGFVIISVFMIAFCSNKGKGKELPVKSQKKEASAKKIIEKLDKDNKVVFFEGCDYAFNLEDLLRASAEMLGKGTFGTTYKAALEDATTVVVKRLKEVDAGKKDFEQQMELVGRIRHENVAALRAYYCSKDEKLLVYDYYRQGSVSLLLHGRGEGLPPLDWESRLKIAIGTARGITYLHAQSSGKLVHGNLKASNIFINPKGYGCVSDVGLAPLMNSIPTVSRFAGYRAPEITDSRKATQASDVYSFGVFLLELLTGKSPTNATSNDEVTHLVRWVHSVVREEWTAEVFDVDLLRYPNIEEEMVEMLQIGMACVVRVPDQRPKMNQVLNKLEEIRQPNTPKEIHSGSKSGVSTSAPSPMATEVASSSLQNQMASAIQSQIESSSSTSQPQVDPSSAAAQ